MLPEISRLSIATLPWSVDWGSLFSAIRPLILEIGFGRGAFLRHLSRTFPEASIIGLEVSNHCLDIAEKLIARERLDNVRVIHAPADTALYHLFEPASIQQIHINFPDPWFKSDHQHRRLIQPDMVELLTSRLVTNGELYLATDIREYADMSTDLLESAAGLENLLPERWVNSFPGRAETKYEATARKEGRMCYYFAYRRTDLPVREIPVVKELDMPHAVVHVPLTLTEIAERFEPIKASEGDIHIHLMDVFMGQKGLLIETHIAEPTIRQHVALSVYQYDHGRIPDAFTIQLSTIGQPRATVGAHATVRILRDWLLTLHPEAELMHEKVLE